MAGRSGTGKKQKRPKARSYHHGDLRETLVEVATAILREKGADALTLRATARRAGVSQAAPYRHFADRRALVAAVAERGFARLQGVMLERMQTAPEGGRAGLKEVARAYVQFGLSNPAEYRVMFGSEVAITDDLPHLRETARGVLGFVAEGIRRLQEADLVGPGDPWLIAMSTWATLHGLVVLTLDGQIAGIAPNIDVVLDEATRIMMFGMAKRPAEA
jgi:AcrR family transcriptional regulator